MTSVIPSSVILSIACIILKLKYNPEFINIGFTKAMQNSDERPQNVLCRELLCNESLKMNKLDNHPHMKHSQHPSKTKEFVLCKAETFKSQCFDNTHIQKYMFIFYQMVINNFTLSKLNYCCDVLVKIK